MKFEKGQRVNENPLYYKIAYTYRSMRARCYNKNSENYKRYGEIGIYICDDWQTLSGFIEDIDKIEGWDLDKFLNSEIQLDKDIKSKQLGVQPHYSLETCMFVSLSDNCGARQDNQEMIIISPSGEFFETSNREKFCREHGLDSRHAFNCLKKQSQHYKGWQFFYKSEFSENDILKQQKIKGISPNGDVYFFNNISKFAKEHGLIPSNISNTIKGKQKHHKQWQFIKICDGIVIQ